MDTLNTIARPIQSQFSDTSFDEDLRGFLVIRYKLFFAIGFFVTLIIFSVEKFFLPNAFLHELVYNPLAPYNILSHSLSFAVAWLYLHFTEAPLSRIRFLVVSVIVLNLIFIAQEFTFSKPDELPMMPFVLILYLHAALIPCQCRFQWAFVLTAISSFLFFQLWSYFTIPIVTQYWLKLGGMPAFQDFVIGGVIRFGILGFVSVFINKTLYSLRKELSSAQKLGNYVIEKKLGEGGMGTVYVARHTLMCRPTAVKVMQVPPDSDQKTTIDRFEREVRLSSTLSHPNNITIFDFGRTDGNTFFYAMEFLEGMDLQAFVEKYGPLPAERVVFILKQICGALQEAHAKNIIHRDIKPSNIFITHRGGLYDFAKILDFGLAKRMEFDKSTGVTKTGAFFGTPTYIAPEMVYGNEDIDQRVDIYNLGAVVYWLLTGKPPFSSEKSIEVMIDHVKTMPKKPSTISETPIPKELDDIVMKCLAKDRDDRFTCASALVTELENIPFEMPWSQNKAKEWWKLHMPLEEYPCGCAEDEPKVKEIQKEAKNVA